MNASLKALVILATVSFVSCKQKEQKEVIIVPVPKEEVKKGTLSMQETNSTRDIEWLNANYQIVIRRQTDKSLPLTRDEYGQDYYDNVITLRVLRADGTEAFKHVFHKTDFSQYITDSNVKSNGALLGVVFDRVEDGNLVFAASVGSPNDKSDEYIPLVMHINRMGAVSVALDTSMDADATGGESQPLNIDDEGV